MKLGIMQPYFLPYLGYFQLIAAVDQFIVYDNIKYTKKGWINRNRFLRNGTDAMFTLSLKNDSNLLNVCDRELAADFDSKKLLNQLMASYRGAPYFEETFPLIEKLMQFPEKNLFRFLHNSILLICSHLAISTKIITSSMINIDHQLNGQEKVLALCKALNATSYVNPISGKSLYSKQDFANKDIKLNMIHSLPFQYPQFNNVFVPWLSIIDVMLFNPLPKVQKQINCGYTYE